MSFAVFTIRGYSLFGCYLFLSGFVKILHRCFLPFGVSWFMRLVVRSLMCCFLMTSLRLSVCCSFNHNLVTVIDMEL